MKRLLFIAALLLPITSFAQEPAPAPATEEAAAPADAAPAAEPEKTGKPESDSMDTNEDGKVDEAETAAATEKDADVTDAIKEGAEVVEAAKELANKDESDMPTGTLILVLLGAIFKFLLSTMKLLGKNVPWFKTKDGKRVVKYSTLALGAVSALVANLAFGMHWIEAMQLLLSGPIAIGIHEYTKDSKDSPPEAPAEGAA